MRALLKLILTMILTCCLFGACDEADQELALDAPAEIADSGSETAPDALEGDASTVDAPEADAALDSGTAGDGE